MLSYWKLRKKKERPDSLVWDKHGQTSLSDNQIALFFISNISLIDGWLDWFWFLAYR